MRLTGDYKNATQPNQWARGKRKTKANPLLFGLSSQEDLSSMGCGGARLRPDLILVLVALSGCPRYVAQEPAGYTVLCNGPHGNCAKSWAR